MNNMGNIKLCELRTFASRVFKELDLEGWCMEWTTDVSICVRHRKLIQIHVHDIKFRIYPGDPWQAKEAVLHEVAHIFTLDKFHSEDFYREYTKLLIRFMAEEPV